MSGIRYKQIRDINIMPYYMLASGNTSSNPATNIYSQVISASTYYNLPTDVYVTGATYSNNTFTYTNNTGGTFNVLFNTLTGLTINGDLIVSGNSQSWFSGNSSSDLVRITQTGSGNALVVEDSNNPDASQFVVDNTGNVGIGTNTPISKIQISNTATTVSTALYTSDFITLTAEGTAPGLNIISAGDGVGNRGVFKSTRSRGTLSSPTLPQSGDFTFSLLGAVYDGVTNFATAGISYIVDGSITANTAPQRIIFETSTGNTRTERMRITSDGKVGIGVTPTAQLSVKATAVPSAGETIATFQVSDASGTFSIQNYSNSDAVFIPALVGNQASGANQIALNLTSYIYPADDTGTNPLMTFRSATNALTVVTTRPLFDFRNWNTSVMLLAANGNVGIGTTSPTEKLHVSGNTLVSGGLTATTISATTYYNLPTDVRVTGGTYSNGTLVFTNNTGGTFNVTGLYTGGTDVFVTGGTYSSGTGIITFTNNTGGTFNVTGITSGSSPSFTNVDYIDFNTTATTTHQEGRIHWNDDIKSLEIDTENAGVQIQVGHQNVVRIYNGTGGVLSKGTAVYITGEQGQRPSVSVADWTTDASSASVIGLVMDDINNGANGYVITFGILEGLNTIAYSAGTPLYLYSGGTLTSTKPIAPYHDVRIGKVVVSNATTGSIFVNVQNGYELDELHDVQITGTTISDETIIRDAVTGLWKNSFIPPLSSQEIFRGITFRNNSTTIDTYGGIVTSTSASNLAQSVSSTDFKSKQIRLRYYASVVSTGRYTGVRGSTLLWYIGGGFRFVCDWNISDTAYTSDTQQFFGLASQTTDLNYGGASLILVSTLTNIIGVGNETGDSNLQVFYNDASGTASKVDLGSGFPANRTSGATSTTVYSVEIYNPVASSEVRYKVTNKETGAVAQGSLTTNIPATTAGLTFFASRAMGTPTTNTGQFDLLKLGVYSLL